MNHQSQILSTKFQVRQIDLSSPEYAAASGDESDLEIIETQTGPHALSEIILPSKGCIPETQALERMAAALAWDIPSVAELAGKYAGRKVILCGGGTSLKRTLPDIREALAGDDPPLVMAVNKTHDWLIAEGITPDFAVLMDPREHIPDYITPTAGVKYLYAATLDPRAFDLCRRFDVYLWHPKGADGDLAFLREAIKKHPERKICLVPGPSTVGLRALYLAMDILGFSTIEMHGFDSCYDYDTSALWPYAKTVTFESVRIPFTVFSKATGQKLMVTSNPDMSRQTYEFDTMITLLIKSARAGARRVLPNITVAGDGAIPWMAWKNGGHAAPERMAAKYGDAMVFDYDKGCAVETDLARGRDLNQVARSAFAPGATLPPPKMIFATPLPALTA